MTADALALYGLVAAWVFGRALHRWNRTARAASLMTALVSAGAVGVLLAVIAPAESFVLRLIVALACGAAALVVDRRLAAHPGARLRRIGGAALLAAVVAGCVVVGFAQGMIAERAAIAAAQDVESTASALRTSQPFTDRRSAIQGALTAAEQAAGGADAAYAAAQKDLAASQAVRTCNRACRTAKTKTAASTQAVAGTADAALTAANAKAATDTALLDADLRAAVDQRVAGLPSADDRRAQATLDVLHSTPSLWLGWAVLTVILLIGDALVLGLLRSGRSSRTAPEQESPPPAAAAGETRPLSGARGPEPATDRLRPLRPPAPIPAAGPQGRTEALGGPTAATTILLEPPLERQAEPERVEVGHAPSTSVVAEHTRSEQTVRERALPAASAVTDLLPAERAQPRPAELATTLAWLNGVAGADGRYLLAMTVNRIGRNPAMDVVVDRPTVSRHHCTITHVGQELVLQAETSANGTYRNGERVAPDRPVVLNNGDVVGLGERIRLEVFIPPNRTGHALAFRAASVSDPGRRGSNEDAAHADERIVAVADGVGGMPAGEVASSLAVRSIEQVRAASELVRTVHALNAAIRERGLRDPSEGGLATTLDAAVMSTEDGAAWVRGVHVGDGVAILLKPLRVEPQWLTRAHTLGAEIDAARGGQGGFEHPQGERLMRAVGFKEDLQIDEWQEKAEEGQRYVLATDGLVKALGVAGLRAAIAELRVADPAQCAKELIARAVGAGAEDNVTVVIADVVVAAEEGPV